MMGWGPLQLGTAWVAPVCPKNLTGEPQEASAPRGGSSLRPRGELPAAVAGQLFVLEAGPQERGAARAPEWSLRGRTRAHRSGLSLRGPGAGAGRVEMLKFKAFCLDYWQFLCLQPLHGVHRRYAGLLGRVSRRSLQLAETGGRILRSLQP